MQTRIEANVETLMRQAPMTVESYLVDIIQQLDGRFGEGYAKKNPAMVASLVRTCSIDLGVALVVQELQSWRCNAGPAEEVACALLRIAHALGFRE